MATLKVRVRAASGGPTLRVQLQQPCTLQALKDAIALQIEKSASSFEISLNKKDPISGPPDLLLSAFGVINGDLVFYIPSTGSSVSSGAPASFNVLRNASPHSTPTSIGSSGSNLGSPSDIQSTSSNKNKTLDPSSLRRELCAAAALQRTTLSQPEASSSDLRASPTNDAEESRLTSGDSATCSRGEELKPHSAKGKDKMDSTIASASGNEVTEMEIEEDEHCLTESLSSQKSYSSLPDLLQRVLQHEHGKVKERQAFLVLAIHAVMLETGFVLQHPTDAVGSSDRCGLPVDWSGKGGLANLTYTLPEITTAASASAQTSAVGDALLRCQFIGNFLVVYGAVTGGQGSEVYRLSLPVSRYLQKDFVVEDKDNTRDALKNLAKDGEEIKEGATPMECLTSEGIVTPSKVDMFCNVFELWQQVKDNLSLPLLTCICEKAGLQPPASLLLLPTELKIKLLENLPAAALATLCCVCSELKFLASSEELWKARFKAEFKSDATRAPGGRGWKVAYARELARKRRREEDRRVFERQLRSEPFLPLLMRPPPVIPHFPGVLGGDYDRFPALGNIGGFRPRSPGGAYWSTNYSGANGIGEPDELSLPGQGVGRGSLGRGRSGRSTHFW
ncbi:uncharacterized protein [Physcomitrium patens]|uniref:F-box domain-containing protein n=2 Tax=Physcomitrium patens TaxID=3218 RepID=A0A7I4ATQ3_PHYPA|nr:F-box protein SKIP22-like [Physcomitrium patens]|eukprot:XP_024396266.1 F-box protein SKIP22-like [Physcomitrella patens]